MDGLGPLAGLRIVEHCGWWGVFAGRLLADAGADVVRVVSPGGDPLETEPPFFGESGVSIQETWYNAGKRILRAGGDTAFTAALADAVRGADILVEDWTPGGAPLNDAQLGELNPGLVRVSVSPLGTAGQWSGYEVNDLVANALSGAASVTGNADTPPVNGYGNQTCHTVGLYVATCALAALRARRLTGTGQRVTVNAHEALVSCTEQVLMEWFFPAQASWTGAIAPRQGSLHWSGAYEVYPGRTGRGIMVTVALKLFESLLPWLEEEGAAQGLADREKYPDPIAIIRDVPYAMKVMRDWVATHDADELFYEAQRRHQPFGVVWDVATATRSPQIEARCYFQPQEVEGFGSVPFPGRLFRTDRDGPHPRPGVAISVKDLGWEPRDSDAVVQRQDVSRQRPLEGIRVMDFTHVLAGPFGTRVLGDLGADVIKVGTEARGAGANSPMHPYYTSWNRNKRSIMLNLGSERGLEVARALALRSDIITENFRAGVLARWGLDRASLKDGNPGISVIAMGGMGQTGPWKDFVTFAPTIHALVGLTYLTNPPGRHDLGYGFSLTDHLSGLAAALAACGAIEHRHQTGEGLDIDLAQYELGLGIMGPAYLDYFANGRNPEPVGNRHPFDAWAPHSIYRCAGDDEWVAIAARGDEQWQALCRVIGQPGLTGDPHFATHEQRVANIEELDRIIESWTVTHDRYDVMERCQVAGIAAGAVQNAEDLAYRDPQVSAAGFFGTAWAENWGEYGVDRFPALFDGRRRDVYKGVHQGGEDTFDVMKDVLGLDDGEIATLVAEGVLS